MILRKITKLVANRCHISKLKCSKYDFGWTSAQDPVQETYCAPQDPLAGFNVLLRAVEWPKSRERDRREEKGRKGGEGRGGCTYQSEVIH